MIRDILIMLAAVAAVVAFAPKVSHGVNAPAKRSGRRAGHGGLCRTTARRIVDAARPRTAFGRT